MPETGDDVEFRRSFVERIATDCLKLTETCLANGVLPVVTIVATPDMEMSVVFPLEMPPAETIAVLEAVLEAMKIQQAAANN
jgi:hypothetical protein